jgi:N-acetylneuraminic acid mutarotase/pimeloyl-ACP methyl ester carboxylesterase
MHILAKIKLLLIILVVFASSSSTVKASFDIIGTWVQGPSLPYEIANYPLIINGDKIYIISGSAYGVTPNIIYGQLSQDGSINSWTVSSTQFPTSLFWHSIVTSGNNLYVIGGNEYPNNSIYSIDKLYKTNIQENGMLGTWSISSQIPNRLAHGAGVVVGNRVYYVGGGTWTNGWNQSASSAVYMAEIGTDGNLSTWGSAGGMPLGLMGHSVIYSGKKLLVFGGYDQSGTASNKIFSADLDSTGKTTNWTELAVHLPHPAWHSMIVKAEDYIVLAGGRNNLSAGSGIFQDVYFSKIGEDGNPTSWVKSSNSLPKPNCCAGVAYQNGKIYIAGGHDGYDYYKSVWITTVNFSQSVKSPIVIVPGIGASWNYEAIVHGKNVPHDQWSIAPFVKVYDGLIKALDNIGYEKDDDYYVYAYDWRKSIKENSLLLKEFIDSHVLEDKPAGTKVTIIGHSMGGLITRELLQSDASNQIGKSIILGAPNSGSSKVYKMWEGADFSDMERWQSIAIKLLLFINKGKYSNIAEEIHNEFSSLQNLLPTYEYLYNRDGTVKPLSNLKWQNNYLNSLNNISLPTYIVSGIGNSTVKNYVVKERNSLDKLIGRWEDGVPISSTQQDGDGTVLSLSSQIPGGNNIVWPQINHTELISSDNSQTKIFNLLGLNTEGSAVNQPAYANALVITIGSPATFTVYDPMGQVYNPTEGILVIDNPQPGSYQVVINSTGTGKYIVYYGRIVGNKEYWGQEEGYFNDGSESRLLNITYSPDNGFNYREMINQINKQLEYLDIRLNNLPYKFKNNTAAKVKVIKIQLKDLQKDGQPSSFYAAKQEIVYKLLTQIEQIIEEAPSQDFDPVIRTEIFTSIRSIRWLVESQLGNK